MVSLRGQFINWYFTRNGFKNGMAKDIKRGNRRAAMPKPAVMRRNSVEVKSFQGRQLWYLHPKSGKQDDPSHVILFFHGGAYFYDVLDVHFAVWAQAADITGALAILPSYYRGDLEAKDPRVSPIYGLLSGLPPMTVVTGSRDLLHPDILRFSKAAKALVALTVARFCKSFSTS